MIKHIVLWNLKDEVEGKGKLENAHRLKQELESLAGKIPGLIKIQVGLSVQDSQSGPADADVVLYTEFESLEALEKYYLHPEHTKIVPFAKSIRNERKVINYATD